MKLLETLSDFEKQSLIAYAHNEMKVEPATLVGVIITECSGEPFDSKGRIVIQYEGHTFYEALERRGINAEKIAMGHPSICYMKWSRKFYRPGTDDDYERLELAKQIHENAALESCSWGCGQVMGYHWKRLGFLDVQSFVESNLSALGQLKNFVKYIQTGPELGALQRNDMHAFFTFYNGIDYKQHHYDELWVEGRKWAIESGW